MGILSRISKVFESNVNSLLDRAEDPGKVLEQAIEDMKRGRNEARQAIIEAKTQQALLKRRRDKALADAKAYESKAMEALRKEDEDLARKAVELKLAAEQRAAAETTALEEQGRQISELQVAERELERRLSEMPAKRAALMARQAAAQARGAQVGAATKAKNSVSTALEAFERMEERTIRAEVEAEVIRDSDPQMLLESGASSSLEAESTLEALKARVAKEIPATTQPSPEPEPEEAPTSAVDDSLAALKAKLQ